MNRQLITEIEKSIKEVMQLKRYTHTLGVVDAAIYLANKYGADPEEARIAALLHDYAKDYTEEELKAYVLQHQLEVDKVLLEAYQLLHGKVAASIAEIKFSIKNRDILNAIENHTTGRENMSMLEKIIYLADFIELGRSYPGVDELRLRAEESLDKAVLMAFNNTIKYVLDIEKLLHPNTILARNEILSRLEGK